MRITFLLLLISFSGYSQQTPLVKVEPTLNSRIDSSFSYIYCSSMEMMWNELSQYLKELPASKEEIGTFETLNQSISNNYSPPLEDSFHVCKAGLVKDSIVQQVNDELAAKFSSSWTPSIEPTNEALIAYAHLKRNLAFSRILDDKFYQESFNDEVDVDYFGIDQGMPDRKSKHVLIHDYQNKDDFIVEVKCRDTLDQIYFAKISPEETLNATFEEVIRRVESGNTVYRSGSDILKIPYLKFEIKERYDELEGLTLSNASLEGKSFQLVTQKIDFELSPNGVILESIVESIIDFADFDYPPPRVLSFNKPFLIVMKRKNSDLPYFVYWVAGAEFMRSYIPKPREIKSHEKILVGTWKNTAMIMYDGTEKEDTPRVSYSFEEDGTYSMQRQGYDERIGEWRYTNDTLFLKPITFFGRDFETEFTVFELTEKKMVFGDRVKLVLEKE